MSITGKLIGFIAGLLLFRNPWGAIIGLILGHFYDQGVSGARRTGGRGGAGVLEIGERFFTATFEVMGHVAKADGRVSEEEIAAARKVMAELRLSGPQIHAAIHHFTRGKSPDFDLEATMQQFIDTCADRPDLLRVFLEVQVRACLEGVDMQGAGGVAVQKVADLLDVSRIELAHIVQVLRLRREQFRSGGGAGPRNGGAQAPPRSSMQMNAAYQILEVDPKATNEEVAKAYRRQLSKHHPDKLKANGLPDSMLEHAKQRTQQIIEAYELIKSARGA
jgi:DnaJ like chaperone protein